MLEAATLSTGEDIRLGNTGNARHVACVSKPNLLARRRSCDVSLWPFPTHFSSLDNSHCLRVLFISSCSALLPDITLIHGTKDKSSPHVEQTCHLYQVLKVETQQMGGGCRRPYCKKDGS